MHATDIVAYTYQAETLCPACVNHRFNADGRLGYDVEPALDWHAKLKGIDRHDERSFDSGDFPKVVFADQIEYEAIDVPDDSFIGQGWRAERCDGCGEALL